MVTISHQSKFLQQTNYNFGEMKQINILPNTRKHALSKGVNNSPQHLEISLQISVKHQAIHLLYYDQYLKLIKIKTCEI